MKVDKKECLELYRGMQRIRQFEDTAMKLSMNGEVPGFLHLYTGEEAIATGVCSNLRKDDYITSTHRGHGHIAAKGGDLATMFAELLGKKTGYCHGKGGSMHIADPKLGILGANGIVGAGHEIAAGAGYGIQIRGTDQVCVCFFGDASTNQCTFHEGINVASVWKLPVVFVCENNLYGISVRQDRHQNIHDVADRAAAYGIPGIVVDGNDVLAVKEASAEAIDRARRGLGPTLIECKTYRHHGHFVGDPANYRPKEEVEAWMQKDPIKLFPKYLLEHDICTEAELKHIEDDVAAQIEAGVKFAKESPYPDPEDALKDVYSDMIMGGRDR